MTAKIKNRNRYHSLRHKPRGVKPHSFKQVYWPYLPVLLILVILSALAIQSGNFSNAIKNKGNVLAYSSSMSRRELLSNTNLNRADAGAKPLKANSLLNQAAQAKANDMAKKNYWSHNTPSGDSPWTFVEAKGYQYQKLGENLAAGFINAGAVVKGWLASPSHKANLLDPAYSEVGFGYANSPNFKAGNGPMTIVVAFYGRPAGAAAPLADQNRSLPPPATTSNPYSARTLAEKTSNAQVALAKSPLGQVATSAAAVLLFVSLFAWLGRHFRGIRNAWRAGERFVIKHPLFDVCLIAIAVLSFILAQTAGYIQ